MWLLILVFLTSTILVVFLYVKHIKLKVNENLDMYRCKDFLLTKTEKIAFDKINTIIDKDKLCLSVFPKTRLTDFLWTPKEDRNSYLKIQSKFVDFLIVKKPQLHPFLAIFIENKENKPKMNSLEIIEPVLKKSGIKLLKIEAKDIFTDKFEKLIKEALK